MWRGSTLGVVSQIGERILIGGKKSCSTRGRVHRRDHEFRVVLCEFFFFAVSVCGSTLSSAVALTLDSCRRGGGGGVSGGEARG